MRGNSGSCKYHKNGTNNQPSISADRRARLSLMRTCIVHFEVCTSPGALIAVTVTSPSRCAPLLLLHHHSESLFESLIALRLTLSSVSFTHPFVTPAAHKLDPRLALILLMSITVGKAYLTFRGLPEVGLPNSQLTPKKIGYITPT